jgi:hypothetical protein
MRIAVRMMLRGSLTVDLMLAPNGNVLHRGWQNVVAIRYSGTGCCDGTRLGLAASELEIGFRGMRFRGERPQIASLAAACPGLL